MVSFPGVVQDLDADLFKDEFLVRVLVGFGAECRTAYTKYPASSTMNWSCDQKE